MLDPVSLGLNSRSKINVDDNECTDEIESIPPQLAMFTRALAVVEYLIANGSDRAVDDILECSSKIAAVSSFEYVEPNGKDLGINVRKKAETILGLGRHFR
ncbi:hypothetical protein J5N97_003712 [Dioscorea zingiberensis]|uniref:ENTH domain-containing protein n=1 Tax=Dioscorea zingiberensis TaxID=325984 RepID=A0A9D5D4R6_9LILI|nr:hypothetical protein J5N97_003712 [Dioscorea zingiberensis]